MKPSILIAGAGDTGTMLARQLSEDWAVTIIDNDAELLASEQLKCCVRHQLGDATSPMVLRQSGADKAQVVVAITDSDEKNVELLKQAREEFGIEQLYAVIRDNGWEQRYWDVGIELVDRSSACAAMLASRISGGQKMATNIGLGKGEIMEVEVLANSSVIGRHLADLRPRHWLIGAVYRQDHLIVPHGDTVIEEGDRVVVIGEPEILPLIASQIRAGESEFPLHYGSKIIALGSRGLPAVLDEVRYLLGSTAARGFTVLAGRNDRERVEQACSAAEVEIVETELEQRQQLAAATATRDVGLVVLEPQRLSLLARFGLQRSPLVRLIDQLSAPALICRGSFPYNRVLLALAELPFDLDAAQLAIDLTRKLDAELHLGVVHQPELVVGEERRGEVDEQRRRIEKLARMYHVSIEVDTLSGNPIEELVRKSAEVDLLVLPYKRHRRSSLTRPDVGQSLIHGAACSVLVMPV